jgi:hypothetical protein
MFGWATMDSRFRGNDGVKFAVTLERMENTIFPGCFG